MLRSALVKILHEDKRIKVLWESRVKKMYPDWDYMKAQSAITKDSLQAGVVVKRRMCSIS
jgi:hypothetical protein